MNLRSVSDIIGNGGTMLYTARSEEFKTLKGQQKAAKHRQPALLHHKPFSSIRRITCSAVTASGKTVRHRRFAVVV